MNRKLINGLLLLATATAGVGMFTSCKDTDEDFHKEQQVTMKALEDKLTALEGQVSSLESYKSTIQGMIDNLRSELQKEIDANKDAIDATNGRIDTLVLEISKLQGDIDAINTKIDNINTAIDTINGRLDSIDGTLEQQQQEIENLNTLIDTLKTELQSQIDTLKTDLTNLTEQVDLLSGNLRDLDGQINGKGGIIDQLSVIEDNIASLDSRLTDVEKDAADALAQAQVNAAAIKSLQELCESYGDRIGTLETDVRELQEALVEQIEKLNDLESRVAKNEDDIADLYDSVEANSGLITELQTQMGKVWGSLTDILLNKVTGVITELAVNPVFGTFNSPFGMKNNMLLAQAGIADVSGQFPTTSTANEFNNTVENAPRVTAADMAVLTASGITPESYTSGDVLAQGGPNSAENQAYAGTLYMTVNPASVDFNNIKVNLMTSDGKDSPVGDLRIQKSDDRLKYGYTRAENGFYKAEVNFDKTGAALNDLHIDVNKNLATTLKDAVKNRTLGDFARLAQAVYDQFNGILDAYAINVNYSNVDGQGNKVENSVSSGYNVALATYKPLSYCFAYGESINHQLPTFSPISEILDNILDDFKFNLKVKDLDFSFSLNAENIKIDNFNIIIPLENIPVYDNDGNVVGYINDEIRLEYNQDGSVSEAADGNLTSLSKALEDMVKDMFDNINSQLETQVADLVSQINGMMTDLNGQINDQMADIINKIKNQLGNKLDLVDNLIDKYNRLAGKINNMLKNPNAYLQVMMAYQGADGNIHRMSNNPTNPTIIEGNGEAIELFATSHTLELFASSYAKVVAVVAGDNDAALAKINKDSKLDHILPGRQQRIALKASELKSGVTYTILYTSLDYAGHTSTNKYYIRKK